MYLTLILLAVFAICIGFTLPNGLWGNGVLLIIVVMSALFATNYFERLVFAIEKQNMKSYTYLLDFISLWGMFALCAIVLRAFTDKLSKVKVKFRQPFDQIGGIILGAWVGWVMVCFTLFSFHTAPLARNFLQGEFQEKPDSKMLFGLAPDRQWLGFAQKSSMGAFSRGQTFDPNAEFILKYSERRARFEKEPQPRVN
jgi:hypothetical protein